MRLIALSMLLAALSLLPVRASAQSEQQTLVDRATLTVQELLSAPNSGDRQWAMKRAKAVMICPRVFRASFLFGGAGGDCVLVARNANNEWSSPAFFQISSASFGLQAGVQESEILLVILTDKGLKAVMDDRFKIGGDASVAFAQMGAGVEAATTAALHADILAFAQSAGLYAGISLNGSLITAKSDWDRAYYGRDVGAREIVIDRVVNNPGADPLRGILARYAAPEQAPPATAELPPPPPSPPAGTGETSSAPQPLGPVEKQDLAPPKN
jgi:lipid-binding SYLF domain-containing protein